MKTLAWVLLVLALTLAAAASTVPAKEGWRVIGRGTDAGDQVVVATATKRRTARLAMHVRVRVRVRGEPETAKPHTIVTCHKAGAGMFSRRDTLRVKAPAMRVLPVQPASIST